MDTQKLSIAIQAFIKKQSTNAAYYEENWNERKERKAYVFVMSVKNKKGHRQGRPIDRTIVSYLAGGLSRMSGITTGSCSGGCPRSSDLEADLARPCFSPTVPS